MLADKLARMIDNASVIVYNHVDARTGYHKPRFIRTRNPKWKVGTPKPHKMPAKVWLVWIDGLGTYLLAPKTRKPAMFDAFEDAYIAALDAKLVPPLE